VTSSSHKQIPSSGLTLLREATAVKLGLTQSGWAGDMELIISDAANPSLFRLFSLLYRDVGKSLPAPGHILIPGECGPNLRGLEESASKLSMSPAPEDRDAAEAVSQGEEPRYLDSEMASLALGEPELARSIANRIEGGPALLEAVECVREYLEGKRR
jgi:hypothetical protein